MVYPKKTYMLHTFGLPLLADVVVVYCLSVRASGGTSCQLAIEASEAGSLGDVQTWDRRESGKESGHSI